MPNMCVAPFTKKKNCGNSESIDRRHPDVSIFVHIRMLHTRVCTHRARLLDRLEMCKRVRDKPITRGDAVCITITMRNRCARLEVSWSSLRRRWFDGVQGFSVSIIYLFSPLPQINVFYLVNGRFRTTSLKICDSIRRDFSETLENRPFWHEEYPIDDHIRNGLDPIYNRSPSLSPNFGGLSIRVLCATCYVIICNNSTDFSDALFPFDHHGHRFSLFWRIVRYCSGLVLRKCHTYKYMCIFWLQDYVREIIP